MNKPIGAENQQQKWHNAQKRKGHCQLGLLRAKIDLIEIELKEVTDQLKVCQLAGTGRLRRNDGGLSKIKFLRREINRLMESENALIKERICATVAVMERHHQRMLQNQKEISAKFSEFDRLLLATLLMKDQTNFVSSSFIAASKDNLKSPIWVINLFERRQFRNGNSTAQCMECGQKFSMSDEDAMGWHIVQRHPQYAPKLLQKQLEKDVQQKEQFQQMVTEIAARKKKRKKAGEEEEQQQKKKSKLFKDL